MRSVCAVSDLVSPRSAAPRFAGTNALRPVPCQADGALSPLRLLASRCVDESLAEEKGRTAVTAAVTVDAAGAQRHHSHSGSAPDARRPTPPVLYSVQTANPVVTVSARGWTEVPR